MKTLFKKYISYCALLPLAVFVWVARYKGLFSEIIKSDAWQYPFYYGAMSALIVISIYFVLRLPINQLALSVNIFLIGSAILFIVKNEFLLSLLSNYSGSAFFLAMIITGILTLFIKDTCIGEPELTISQNAHLSHSMLLGCILAFIWSLLFNNCGIVVSIAVPFVILRLVSYLLIKVYL